MCVLTPIAEAPRILIVDDHDDSLDLDIFLLARLGADIRGAHNGQEALALLDAWEPTVLVTELYLPDMTAADLATRLRAMRTAPTPLRVIITTSHAMARDRATAIAAGFEAFLPKPLEFDALFDAIACR